MGWSCSSEAYRIIDKWSEACRKSTGSSNTWKQSNGQQYFFEISRIEHDDGAITGTIWRFLPNSTFVRKSGSFRIDGYGRIIRAPKFLKDASTWFPTE